MLAWSVLVGFQKILTDHVSNFWKLMNQTEWNGYFWVYLIKKYWDLSFFLCMNEVFKLIHEISIINIFLCIWLLTRNQKNPMMSWEKVDKTDGETDKTGRWIWIFPEVSFLRSYFKMSYYILFSFWARLYLFFKLLLLFLLWV